MSDPAGWIVVGILAFVGSGCGAFVACAVYLAGRAEREERERR